MYVRARRAHPICSHLKIILPAGARPAGAGPASVGNCRGLAIRPLWNSLKQIFEFVQFGAPQRAGEADEQKRAIVRVEEPVARNVPISLGEVHRFICLCGKE